jgi:hypothetical protein
MLRITHTATRYTIAMQSERSKQIASKALSISFFSNEVSNKSQWIVLSLSGSLNLVKSSLVKPLIQSLPYSISSVDLLPLSITDLYLNLFKGFG